MSEGRPVTGDTPNETLPATPGGGSATARARVEGRIGGRYDIIALVGRGGMGNVYKAYDATLEETVALKTLHSELLGDPGALERFRMEVKLARKVTHHHVARTFDTGMVDGVPFLTMEFIEGESLDALLRRERRLAPDAVVRLARQICEALDAAHRVGVIHRDLKPHNVMLEPGGRAVLTDFGIAHVALAASRATPSIVGTPAYMAPEQVRGHYVTPRADLFALGVILFELLTGALPWDGPSPIAIAAARLTTPAPDIRALRPELSRELAAVVARCLELEPSHRYDSALAVMTALAEYDAVPVSATPPTPVAAPSPSTHASRERTIAVLPFSVRGDADDAHLAEGLAEDLIDELSMVRGVKVRPLGAVLPYTTARADPREIGEALGVQVVVEGALRLSGSKFRGRIALISVAEGFQLLAERFEGDAASLFEISARAGAAISKALLGHRVAAPRRPPSDPLVVESYLAARRALRVHWYAAPEEAMKLFETARELAPDDPRILSGAAMASARCTFFGSGGLEGLRVAEELAEQAVRAAPEWPEPYVARAIVHLSRGQLGASLAELGRALERSPDNVDAHELVGQLHLEVGPLDVAVAHLKTTLELDPGVYKARWELAHGHALGGSFDDADAVLSVEVADVGQRRVRDAHRSRTDLWRGIGRWEDQLAASDDGSDSLIVRFVRIRREVVRTAALSAPSRLFVEQRVNDGRPGSRFQLVLMQFAAEMFAAAGDIDAAATMIERAAAAGLADRVWLERCPPLRRLADHEAFRRARDVVEQRVDAMLGA